MKLHITNAWSLGLSILIFFIISSELTVVFHDYIFYRLGINRNILLTLLWSLPFFSAFIASYYSKKYKLFYGLSYILLLPLFGAFVHYINGELGGVIDFRGLSGAIVLFKIYLMVGSIIITIGTILGVAFSRQKA